MNLLKCKLQIVKTKFSLTSYHLKNILNYTKFFIYLLPLYSCCSFAQYPNNVIYKILSQQKFSSLHLVDSAKHYRIQINYTQIDRLKNGEVNFTNFYLGDTNQYFYPASTVKFPMVLLALEKLKQLNIPNLDRKSLMMTEASSNSKIPLVFNDPKSKDGVPSVENYSKEIFLVSDNDAFNRLYEFVGQEAIHSRLKTLGYPNAIIRHRLEVARTAEQNKWMNALTFLNSSGKIIYQQPETYSDGHFQVDSHFVGKGVMQGDQTIVYKPLNFGLKNRFPLQNLHQIITRLVFEQNFDSNKNFDILTNDRHFVLKNMAANPAISEYPNYPELINWPAYCKFLYYGSNIGNIDTNIIIFNKVGDAYGFLIDVAYIVDLKNQVDFILSACIYTNNDGILNDNKYDYENIGFPFLKELGQTIHRHELTRDRKYKPNLKKWVASLINN